MHAFAVAAPGIPAASGPVSRKKGSAASSGAATRRAVCPTHSSKGRRCKLHDHAQLSTNGASASAGMAGSRVICLAGRCLMSCDATCLHRCCKRTRAMFWLPCCACCTCCTCCTCTLARLGARGCCSCCRYGPCCLWASSSPPPAPPHAAMDPKSCIPVRLGQSWPQQPECIHRGWYFTWRFHLASFGVRISPDAWFPGSVSRLRYNLYSVVQILYSFCSVHMLLHHSCNLAPPTAYTLLGQCLGRPLHVRPPSTHQVSSASTSDGLRSL